MGKSHGYGHTLLAFTAEEKLGAVAGPCSHARCKRPAGWWAEWFYVPNDRGVVRVAHRRYCGHHAARFARRHGLPVPEGADLPGQKALW